MKACSHATSWSLFISSISSTERLRHCNRLNRRVTLGTRMTQPLRISFLAYKNPPRITALECLETRTALYMFIFLKFIGPKYTIVFLSVFNRVSVHIFVL